MTRTEQIESELANLSPAELRQIRDWLDERIEDESEFSPEFEAAVQESERDMIQGLRPRLRRS